MIFNAHAVHAIDNDFIERTSFLHITSDIPKADIVRDFQIGGYELSQGKVISFEDWYAPKSPAVYFEAVTRIDENLAILWGFSSGEFGEKYKIEPSLKLGARYLHQFSDNSDILFSVYRFFGGGFRENTCMADYGAIGGVQKVNCRLAASELPPEQTLEYLGRDDRENWGVNFEFSIRF